jgi:hypothetical protein
MWFRFHLIAFKGNFAYWLLLGRGCFCVLVYVFSAAFVLFVLVAFLVLWILCFRVLFVLPGFLREVVITSLHT